VSLCEKQNTVPREERHETTLNFKRLENTEMKTYTVMYRGKHNEISVSGISTKKRIHEINTVVIRKKFKLRLKSGNTFHHSVQTLPVFPSAI
jgi:hypothetical protein